MAIKQKSDVSQPELLFTGKGDPAADRKVIRLASDGLLLKLYQGIYTSNLASPPESEQSQPHRRLRAWIF